MTALKEVAIYSDGGCDPNPGVGGYGVVLLYGSRRRELYGGFRLTTNNRMELIAVIAGLTALKSRCRVVVHSDSKYVINSMTRGWAERWRSFQWRKKEGGPVPNADLWQQLLELCAAHEVSFRWVRGHSGVPENERCDQLAAAGRLVPELLVDRGYLEAKQQTVAAILDDAKPPVERTERPQPVSQEGQPCRKCGTPVVRREPQRKKAASQLYVYEFYFFCMACKTMYFVNEAKTSLAELHARERQRRLEGRR